MDILLLLSSAGPHCKPIECGVGGRVFLSLREGAEDRSADGSGVLIAEIAALEPVCANAGNGQWSYQFTILPGEIAPAKTVVANDIVSVCCIKCDSAAVLKKLKKSESKDFTIESFRVFADDEEVTNGEVRLFRKHTPVIILSMEVSIALIDSGYPYAEPGLLTVKPIATPVQALGPWADQADGAIINPASSTPMTARYDFVPPLVIDGGRAFGVRTNSETAGIFSGLEVHLQIQRPAEEE